MTDAPLDHLAGSGHDALGFEEIDQQYRLKIRAFIKLCMPSVFRQLEERFDLDAMREQGTIPIMFFLQFESLPRALAFNGAVRTEHRAWLRRARLPGDGGERLLLDMQIDVHAPEGSGDPQQLGGGGQTGRTVRAGRMRGVHVLTRPMAPPGERQVTAVPAALSGLRVHPWEEPYPTVELLQDVPAGYHERAAGPWQEQRSVWGLHNTDINQHVNVHEYIVNMENHLARMLFGAGLPAARHRTARASFLFRKPFFTGDAHGLRGQLWTQGGRTLLLGASHRVEPEGGLEPRPAVMARLEGELPGDAAPGR